MVPYVDDVTVMRVLLFVLCVCMLRECEGDGNAGVGDGGGVVVVSAGHVGGTRGSGIVSSASDLLWMREVGGLCEMCMCLVRAVCVERGLSGDRFGFYQACGNRGTV